MTQIESIIHALKTSGTHLGDLVFWTLSDASVDRATFEARWQTAGLAPELLPEPPTPEKALKAAVREAAVGQPNRLIRLAVENETTLAYAVVYEEKHPETESLTYTVDLMDSHFLPASLTAHRRTRPLPARPAHPSPARPRNTPKYPSWTMTRRALQYTSHTAEDGRFVNGDKTNIGDVVP